MKTAGDYALMWANGTTWTDIVDEIREEAVAAVKFVTFADDDEGTTRP